MTLIELLVVIMIISILAGLILGVASVAGETAREDHTRNVVSRLHTLVMEHYGTYRNRRVVLRQTVPGNRGIEDLINNAIAAGSPRSSSLRGQAIAEARLYALREMMLMEMPDRWSDVLLNDVGPTDDSTPTLVERAPLYLLGRTDLANVYLRRYKGLVGRTNALTGDPNTAGEIRRNQGAECLYMIITLATADGEARSLFGEKTIGDVDGDGAPEFLDGWGHPINFLRWAPGFDSQVQINVNQFTGNPPVGQFSNPAWESAAALDHDPFDPFRVERAAFRLVPLIYSPGRDEDSGINADPDFEPWRLPSPPAVTVAPNSTPPRLNPRLTPFGKGMPNWSDQYLGTDMSLIDTSLDRTSTDNIHNHLLGLR